MKKLLIAGLLVLNLAPALAYAQTSGLTCPAGEQVYTDYSTETPREYCGPVETPTGIEQPQTYQNRSQLSNACQQNVVNCSPSEKQFLSSLITPPTVGDSSQCIKFGGYWNANGNPYQCEFTPAEYAAAFYPPSNSSGSGVNTNTNTSIGAGGTNPNAFCKGGTCTYTPLEPLPGQQGNNLTFAQYIGNIFTVTIVLGGMITVGVLVFAGITYMVSEALPQKDWAKRKVKQALWALLLLLGSYLILSTLNPRLVIFTSSGSIGSGTNTQTCGSVGNTINPLQPCKYITQSGNGSMPASSNQASLPTGAQLNAQQCQSGYYVASLNANGDPNCQPFGGAY